MDEGEDQHHHDKTIRCREKSRETRDCDPEGGQHERQGHEDLRPKDRHSDAEPVCLEQGDGRKGQGADGGHEIDMGQLPSGHARHDLHHVERVTLVFAEVKPALCDGHATQSEDRCHQYDKDRSPVCLSHAHLFQWFVHFLATIPRHVFLTRITSAS